MKTKQLFAWITGAAMLFSLTACGATTETTTAATDAATEATEAQTETADDHGAPPDGGQPNGETPPDKPDGNGSGGFGGSTEVTQGDSANTIDTDGTYSDTSYTSTGDDENALRVDGATVTLTGITVDKSAGATSNTENGDFYGMNAALLATNGATVTISGATVTSSAQNGNGVFSYGSGCTWTLTGDCTITSLTNNGTINFNGHTITLADGTVLK